MGHAGIYDRVSGCPFVQRGAIEVSPSGYGESPDACSVCETTGVHAMLSVQSMVKGDLLICVVNYPSQISIWSKSVCFSEGEAFVSNKS
jgi:hypothetical protein